jgi:hypothetical protein
MIVDAMIVGAIKVKKTPHLRGASKIFFVRVSLLCSLSGLDWGFSDLDFVLVFQWIGGLYVGFGLSVGFQGSWISFVADTKV